MVFLTIVYGIYFRGKIMSMGLGRRSFTIPSEVVIKLTSEAG